MLKPRISNLIIFLFCQSKGLWLNAQPNLQNVFVSDSELHLKCVFDNEKARAFCGVIPAYFLSQSKNVTPQYGVMEFKNKPIVIWYEQCDTVDDDYFMEELIQNSKGSTENELLFKSIDAFSESRTSKVMRGNGLVRYFISIKSDVDTACSGLALNYSEKKKLSNETCSKSIQKELVSYSHMTVKFLEQQVIIPFLASNLKVLIIIVEFCEIIWAKFWLRFFYVYGKF